MLLLEGRGVGRALEGHAAGDALGRGRGAAEPQRSAQDGADAAVLGSHPRREEGTLRAQQALGHRRVHRDGQGPLERARRGQGRGRRVALEDRHHAPPRGHGVEQVAEERVEQRLGGGGRHHGRRRAGEDAEDAALVGERARLEPGAGGEVGHVPQTRARGEEGGVGGRLGGVEDEDPVGHPDLVPVAEQLLGLQADAVEAGPVEASEVAQRPAPRPADDLGVAPREQHVGQDQVAVVGAAQDDPVLAQDEDLGGPAARRQPQVRHAGSPPLTRRSRSPRRGGSTRPTSCRARGRRRPR